MIAGGKYTLDSIIGSGAIGIVFKASHRDLGRTVAIKILNPRYRDDPELLQIFRTEARAASQLEHPNVARVYDYGQEPDGLVYIVMEYLSGYTLGSVLGARRKLTPSRAIDVMMQACAALSAAHDRGIVHRDVKPDNVVLVPAQDDEGKPVEVVKVCDFGIAALGTTKIEEGVAAGTPEYMAPEQTTGSAVTPAADVYACGVVLYEMLAGEVPFTSDQAFRILMKHRTEAPRPPSTLTPGLSPALDAIVLRWMEKTPERRCQTARELRVELRKLVDAKS
jgi:serine/threonine-protein kinase